MLVRQLPQFELDIGRYVGTLRYSPVAPVHVPGLVASHSRDQSEFAAFAQRTNRVLGSQQAPDVRIIDLSAPFARNDRFLWSDGKTAWYHDFAHVSVAGARLLAPAIADTIAQDAIQQSPALPPAP